MVSPAVGTVSKLPHLVLMTLAGLEIDVANAGRSLKIRIAVQVLAQRDVEGWGGVQDYEGKNLNVPRQIPIATQKEAITHVVGRPAVILSQIVLVHGEATTTGGIAVNVAESVETKE